MRCKKLTLSFLASAVILSGCSSPRENVEERAENWQKKSVAVIASVKERARVEIGWDDAVKRMMERNTDLRQSRQDIITADAGIERVWLDMMPVTSLSYSIDRGLTDMAKGSNGQLSIFAFINLPGVISTRMRYFSAVLSKVRAEAACKLGKREKTIALWRCYRDWMRLQERKAWQKMAREREVLSVEGGNAALTEYLSDYAISRETDALQARFSELLGDYASAYVPKSEGLPSHGYMDAPLDPADTAHVGLLSQKLVAIELEGARLRVLGAELNFWPDLSLGISGPPVYSTGGRGTSFWSAKDARAYANVSWQLDTNLSALYNLNETERQVGLMRSKLLEREQAKARGLLDAHAQMKAVRRRLNDVDRRIANALSAPPVANYAQYASWSAELRSLIEERANLSSARDDLDAVFWFMDDSRWGDDDPESHAESDAKLNDAANKSVD